MRKMAAKVRFQIDMTFSGKPQRSFLKVAPDYLVSRALMGLGYLTLLAFA